MDRYTKYFLDNLRGIDFETLEKSDQSIHGFSSDLELIYANPTWARSGREKGMDKVPLGLHITELFKGSSILNFYIQHYTNALKTVQVWHHDYECSSLKDFKIYHQITYPFKNGKGLVIVNTLKVIEPMADQNRKEKSPVIHQYLQPTGFITQCSNCRCTQRVDQPETWDWVPEWIANQPETISHSICPACFDYYWKSESFEPYAEPKSL